MAQPYLPAVLTSSLVATTTGIPLQLAEQWCVSCSAVVAPGSSKVRLRPRKLTCHERARRRAAVAAQQQQVATGATPPTTPGAPVTNVLAVSCLLCGRTMRTAAYDDLRLAAHQVTGTRHGLLVLLLLLLRAIADQARSTAVNELVRSIAAATSVPAVAAAQQEQEQEPATPDSAAGATPAPQTPQPPRTPRTPRTPSLPLLVGTPKLSTPAAAIKKTPKKKPATLKARVLQHGRKPGTLAGDAGALGFSLSDFLQSL